MQFNDLTDQQKYTELVRVFNTMQQYNLKEGWMRWDGDIMRVYTGKVDDGVYVQIGWIRFWVAAYK